MLESINEAISKGAKLYASISGGKDGQAMVKVLTLQGYPIEKLLHADLGRVEWRESLEMCNKLAAQFVLPLQIIQRSDGRDLLSHWEARLEKLKGTGKPFWSSSVNRYCTSDLKRDPINKFLRSTGNNLIISCEGVRAEESIARSKKKPFEIRSNITSTFYNGMDAEEAILNYNPSKRLALTWFPIFNFTITEVWKTFGADQELLKKARAFYLLKKRVPDWWPFHAAYVYGNDRVSCALCILGSLNDLRNGARHNPELLSSMIDMENRGNATFKKDWSLKELL